MEEMVRTLRSDGWDGVEHFDGAFAIRYKCKVPTGVTQCRLSCLLRRRLAQVPVALETTCKGTLLLSEMESYGLITKKVTAGIAKPSRGSSFKAGFLLGQLEDLLLWWGSGHIVASFETKRMLCKACGRSGPSGDKRRWLRAPCSEVPEAHLLHEAIAQVRACREFTDWSASAATRLLRCLH